ncbi:MAG: energy-coupling factor transporter ATPase [Clostridiales bacterium]|nr:energy-coupling factor transporter ATPase [Clostridiales bacterium]
MNHFVELKDISYSYTQGSKNRVFAVKDVNFNLNKGEIVGIIGHTGSGKSTLISVFNGLLKPASGSVFVDGQDIFQDKKTLYNVKFKVGICFQYPEYQLFEETVFKDIAFGPKNMKLTSDEVKQRVISAARYCDISEEMLNKSPFELSGGEKRRVAVAGVMAMNPDILILDEPAAGLDPAGRTKLIGLIRDYNRTTGSAVIIVSHNMEEVCSLCERVVVVNKSKIVLDSALDDVFSHSEMLSSIGLDVPDVTKLFLKLKAAGVDLPTDVYTPEQAAEILKPLINRR